MLCILYSTPLLNKKKKSTVNPCVQQQSVVCTPEATLSCSRVCRAHWGVHTAMTLPNDTFLTMYTVYRTVFPFFLPQIQNYKNKYLLKWWMNKQFLPFLVYLFICAYIVWDISPLCPPPLPSSPHPPRFQAGPVLPSSPILLKRRHKQ
jgi:hypothetical protein